MLLPYGTRRGDRTRMDVSPRDFKSLASTSSAIRARFSGYQHAQAFARKKLGCSMQNTPHEGCFPYLACRREERFPPLIKVEENGLCFFPGDATKTTRFLFYLSSMESSTPEAFSKSPAREIVIIFPPLILI